MKRAEPGTTFRATPRWLAVAIIAVALPVARADEPVAAWVESNAATALPNIRQHVFDGDPKTAFTTTKNAAKGDQVTLRFEKPVKLRSIKVEMDRPDLVLLEVAHQGGEFGMVARLEGEGVLLGDDGVVSSANGVRVFLDVQRGGVAAVRLVCGRDADHPLSIREIEIDSQPKLARFEHPVEFVLDSDDAPDMRPWLEKAARICERAYPMINREMAGEGFKPAQVIHMSLKSSYKGVAATSGDRIVGAVAFFKRHPDDFGAMVHETTHVVQHYQGRGNPGWLVEGVSDYVRFFKYEPGNLGPIRESRAGYDHGYRESAAFLAYLVEKYDPKIVQKLNAAMREGKYHDDLFETLTKKPLKTLGEEWRLSLPLQTAK